MFDKLKLNFRRIFASYLRAFAGFAIAIQVTNLGDLRGLLGVAQAAAVAVFPAVLRAVEALASDVDPDDDSVDPKVGGDQ